MTVTDAQFNSLANDMDTMWLMIGAILVFFMQTGFCMLEVGSVHIKNTKNILIKNLGDACIGAVCWWLIGYGLAFGESESRLFGTNGYALKGDVFESDDGTLTNGKAYAFWIFQWAFSATTATIVSGVISERISFSAYVIYAIVLTSFIYPFVVHWGWAGGWASAFAGKDLLFDCGVIDFAGSTVVHMTGGVAALCAAYIVGPRIGRFDPYGNATPLPKQSYVLQTLGTLIIWFGWYGFNGASTLGIVGVSGIAAKVLVNTTISAAFGGLTTVIVSKLISNIWDISAANNGILAGLVSVTAACATCEPESSMIMGIIGALVYISSSKLLLRMQIDDVVDAIGVHLFCGVWGTIAASLFSTKDNYALAYYGEPDKCAGVFYGGQGNALAANLVFILAVLVWTGVTCMTLFICIKHTVGIRVTSEEEFIGMDDSKHGGRPESMDYKGMDDSKYSGKA